MWTFPFLWCMLPKSHGRVALTTFGPVFFQNGFSQSLGHACLQVVEELFSPFLVAFSQPAPFDTHFPTRVRLVSSELYLLKYFLTSWRQHVPGYPCFPAFGMCAKLSFETSVSIFHSSSAWKCLVFAFLC